MKATLHFLFRRGTLADATLRGFFLAQALAMVPDIIAQEGTDFDPDCMQYAVETDEVEGGDADILLELKAAWPRPFATERREELKWSLLSTQLLLPNTAIRVVQMQEALAS